jgi:hypothetical protein
MQNRSPTISNSLANLSHAPLTATTEHRRRFPSPWDLEDANAACFIVRDHNGLALAYCYYEEEPGRRAAASLMTRDEARRIAANIVRLPALLGAERPEGNPLMQRRP